MQAALEAPEEDLQPSQQDLKDFSHKLKVRRLCNNLGRDAQQQPYH